MLTIKSVHLYDNFSKFLLWLQIDWIQPSVNSTASKFNIFCAKVKATNYICWKYVSNINHEGSFLNPKLLLAIQLLTLYWVLWIETT